MSVRAVGLLCGKGCVEMEMEAVCGILWQSGETAALKGGGYSSVCWIGAVLYGYRSTRGAASAKTRTAPKHGIPSSPGGVAVAATPIGGSSLRHSGLPPPAPYPSTTTAGVTYVPNGNNGVATIRPTRPNGYYPPTANGHGNTSPSVSFATHATTFPTTQKNGTLSPKNGTPSKNGFVLKSANGTPTRNVIHRQTRPLRLAVLGSGGVGKSAITIQFVQQYFICDYDPTIADSYAKQCFVDENMWKLEVLDTAGQDEFASMREQYLRNGDGFLLVFSLTNRESLEYIKRLHRHIDRVKDRDFFPMILVGNKSDLNAQRQISREEAELWAQSVRIPYVECSAKYRLNVDQLFYDLVRLVKQFQANERQSAATDHSDGTANTSGSSGSSGKRRKGCIIM